MFVCCDCCVLSGRGLCDELITRSEESYRLWCVVVCLVKMRSHTQSVVIEPNRRWITGSISYKPLISDLSVLRVCNKTGGIIKGDIKKMIRQTNDLHTTKIAWKRWDDRTRKFEMFLLRLTVRTHLLSEPRTKEGPPNLKRTYFIVPCVF